MLLKTSLFLLFMSLTGTASAELALTQEEMLGTWQIDSEAITMDGRGAKELSSTWTFRSDGTIEGHANDTNIKARVSEMRSTLNYSIENGKIHKQIAPGRSKMEDCVAVKKELPKLVLECNQIFFFMTKK